MTNNTTITFVPHDPFPERAQHFVPIVVLRAIFTVIGVFGNGLVLFIIPRKKQLKTNNDIFLFNLAFADLSYIIFANVRYFYNILDTTPRTLFYCKVGYPVLNIPYNVGIFTITMMAVQRCRVILNPWRPKQKIFYTFLNVAATWFLSILIVLPTSIFAVNIGTNCPLLEHGWTNQATYIYILTVHAIQYPIPLIIIIFAYVKIGVYMSKPRVPRLSVIAKGNTLRSPSDETRKESIQITKTVGVIVLLFAILMLPLQIAMIAGFVFEVKAAWVAIVWDYSDVLGTVNSCLDPFVYSARTKQYRELIAKWVTWLCPWYKGTKRTPGSRYSRNDRSVFPSGENKYFTNNEALRTVEDISIDFPEDKGSIRQLSFSFKNGNTKKSEIAC